MKVGGIVAPRAVGVNELNQSGADGIAADLQPLDPLLVRRTVRMVNAAEYKRQQAPPPLKVTAKAFGMGRRFPIAQKFYE